MTRWEHWSFNAASLTVAVTGLAYFWMKYAMRTNDPFAVVNHPWQGAMLSLHLLASPVFILLFGIILNSHIMRKLRAPSVPNRRSGLLSFFTLAVMVGSGYLLQAAVGERWTTVLVAAHVTSGVLFAGVYAVHLFISVRLVRRGRASEAIREVA
jgi:hypothetical protein